MNNQVKKRKNLFEFIRDNFQKIMLIAICVLYISQGLFSLEKKQATILEIAGNIGLSICVGILISNNLRSMGVKSGRTSEIFIASMQIYGEVKQKATPMFDKLPSWCEYKNAQELEFRKKEIIQGAGLNWRGYKLGFYDEHPEKMNETQKKAFDEAKNCKIVKFYSNELLSDLPHVDIRVKSRFGRTVKDYKKNEAIPEVITKVALGIICGLYTLRPLLTEGNASEKIAGIIWNSMQIILWLIMGMLKYYDAKSFIVDEYRQTHVIQKTELLNEFIVTMQNNPKVIEEYDEDLEIDEFIEEFLSKREKKEDILDEKDEQNTVLD